MTNPKQANIPPQEQTVSEPRYSCPICVGLPMVKLQLSHDDQSLLLDSCQRCGGLWFDAGEVAQLSHCSPSLLESHIRLNANRGIGGFCD